MDEMQKIQYAANSYYNRGLEMAKGKFLLFIDGDDYIASDFVEKLYAKACKTGAEITAGNIVYDEEGNLIRNNFISKQTFKINKEILVSINEKASFAKSVIICGKLFAADFVRKNNLKFMEGCRFEDNEFSFLSTVLADKIALEKDSEYYYVMHSASLMANVFNTETVFDFIKVFKEICTGHGLRLFHGDLQCHHPAFHRYASP